MSQPDNAYRQRILTKTVYLAMTSGLLFFAGGSTAAVAEAPASAASVSAVYGVDNRTAPGTATSTPQNTAPIEDRRAAALLAPHGTLRAAINLGNPVLATRDPITGKPVGVSVDLAQALATRLGVTLQLITVTKASASVDAVKQGQADVGFFAIDPKRSDGIGFTRPYVLIEGVYLVRDNSPIVRNDQVDRTGVTVAVGKGSAYDLFLTRELHHATIVRLPTASGVVQAFLTQHLDVAAGIRQQQQADAEKAGGLRLLDGHFMVIRQAMGLAKDKGPDAAAYLAAFIEQMKATGVVSASLQRHGISGASVATAND